MCMNETSTQVASITQEIEKLTAAISKLSKEVRELGRVTKPKVPRTPSPFQHLRPKNEMSLQEAIRLVLKDGPLSKKDILAGLGKVGYKFAARDPMLSMHPALYKTKYGFINLGGKFMVAT